MRNSVLHDVQHLIKKKKEKKKKNGGGGGGGGVGENNNNKKKINNQLWNLSVTSVSAIFQISFYPD